MFDHVLLRPTEVARLFAVDIVTVRRWSKQGLLTLIKTPGGQNRYLADEVYALRSRMVAP